MGGRSGGWVIRARDLDVEPLGVVLLEVLRHLRPSPLSL
jgi:hypothetical protein